MTAGLDDPSENLDFILGVAVKCCHRVCRIFSCRMYIDSNRRDTPIRVIAYLATSHHSN
jgi:hypothetical protein